MRISAKLDEETAKKYQAVTQHWCLKSNGNILRMLIAKEYDRIQDLKTHKLFLPPEIYERVRVNSFQVGQTPEEYVNTLILERTKD